MNPEKPKPNGSAQFTDDPDAPASAEEIAAAEALRDALADPSIDHEGARLARAASLGHSPRPIDDAELRAIVDRAIAAAPKKRAQAPIAKGRVIRVAFGMAAIVSAAAAVILVMQPSAEQSVRSAPIAEQTQTLAAVRSTQPLFQEPFARSGGASARIDRIARARSSDLRDNRFALRGVR